MLLCLTPWWAVFAAAAISALFVGCLYVGVRGVPNRDDPAVIKQRFVRVGVASALALVVVGIAASVPALQRSDPTCPAPASAARWLGVAAPLPTDALLLALLLPPALTAVLFFGPLVHCWLDNEPLLSDPLLRESGDPAGGARLRRARNLLVGPLVEEWTFRACSCPLLFSAGYSDAQAVWLSAVLFGAAHIHHRYDAKVPWVAVLLQFVYTSLFGAYSSYLFLRTGLIYGPLLAHSFCNLMGLPSFGRVPGHRHAWGLAAAYLAGMASFVGLVVADARCRPRLFHSMFWAEAP